MSLDRLTTLHSRTKHSKSCPQVPWEREEGRERAQREREREREREQI